MILELFLLADKGCLPVKTADELNSLKAVKVRDSYASRNNQRSPAAYDYNPEESCR